MTIKLTVIGAGPGGYVAAIRAAQLGAKVTLIEAEKVGGTCLNWGCIPSKVLIHTANLLEKIHQADSMGIGIEGTVTLDLAGLMNRKNRVVNGQIKGILGLIKRHRIEHITGTAKISRPGRIMLTSGKHQGQEIAWERLIVAAGTKPLNLAAYPFDGDKIWSSNHALTMNTVPETALILGGGVIGCEFANILASLGTKVTLVEALDRLLPLPSVDAACSKVLQREMKKRRIAYHVNRTVSEYENDGDRLKVTLGPSPFLDNPTDAEKFPKTLTVDRMLVCIGRHPNSAELGLETLGVQVDAKGWINVDAYMQTNVENVYAVGDILGPSKVMLAHVASTEGIIAAENALGAKHRMDYHAVPGAIFTSPEVADVGLTEAQAKEKRIDYRAHSVLVRTLGKAQVLGELAGEVKIICEAGGGRVLGVHLVGAHATDLIAEGTLAVRQGLTIDDIAETIHAHPTLAEVMLEVAHKARGHAIHG